MFKRGVSPVIATVLLLVITVVIASIIFAFVIPFVNKSLGNSKACLNVLDGIEFPESRFNCWNASAPPLVSANNPYETGFSVKVKKDGIEGFRIALIDENEQSDVKDIKPGATGSDLKMVGITNSYGGALDFPSIGGQKTYVTKKNTNGKYLKAEIAPITETGDVCPVADIVEFSHCSGVVVF
ncbi:MAG: type IV pilin N-terminal domain-containing protein [Nanoarchaeota archaeon]